jgi:transposase, IS30 family
VSFSEDCARIGDQLGRLIDAGVAVKDAAAVVGISRQRCYAVLGATGHPLGSARAVARGVDPRQVVAVFSATGSVNQAAKACGVSDGRARRFLVAEGLVSAARQPRGKAVAKGRFLELIESGWSAARAAREVGVHERTGRDWRDGIRKTRNTRIHPDGVVVDYRTVAAT